MLPATFSAIAVSLHQASLKGCSSDNGQYLSTSTAIAGLKACMIADIAAASKSPAMIKHASELCSRTVVIVLESSKKSTSSREAAEKQQRSIRQDLSVLGVWVDVV